jgi:adenine-specific DNA methylase
VLLAVRRQAREQRGRELEPPEVDRPRQESLAPRAVPEPLAPRTVLDLATRGVGPAQVRTIEVDDASQLTDLDLSGLSAVRAELHEREKWTKYFLNPEQIELLRSFRKSNQLAPMSLYGSVDVGVVTGRNAFFCMSTGEAELRGLSDVVMPLVARSNQVRGILYTPEDHRLQSGEAVNSYLLNLDPTYDISKHARLFGYKCRIRRQWWSVPSVWTPDAFMLRQISTHPRIIANATDATSTDTVHRVRLSEGVSASKLAVAAFNSVTFAMAEILGRSYGGGVLELEPSEAESLPVPNPDLVPDWLVAEVDRLVRDGDIVAALDLVDTTVLIGKIGFEPEAVARSRSAWERLRDRRTGRKASKRVKTPLS